MKEKIVRKKVSRKKWGEIRRVLNVATEKNVSGFFMG